MHLLCYSDINEYSLINCAADNHIPRYAILSHTWGTDTEEVTFEDLINGTGQDKLGYEKIRFCAEQARKDSLEYCWIDTCCIDKTNKAELYQSIKSMFRWYQNAVKCYVYLSDVSTTKRKASDENSEFTWKAAFRGSRWFTRGWTLQELLAPTSVEFFSRERKRLGDKESLQQQIHEITGIPVPALQGAPLSQFSINERLEWNESRHTKLEEDRAYSLLGIFGVYITPIYGEGTAGAFKRLLKEIDKLERCIRDLRLTNPRDDKKRIEDTKGGLLEDVYRWILGNPDYQRWHDDPQSRLLWIKGDPGKGKTMLLCGIINELDRSIAKSDLLSCFFCQATDSRINNATAVLRSLICLLVDRQPSLVSHIRKKYDLAGKSLFEDLNAWFTLADILTDILQDSNLHRIYLIVDALDECVVGLPKLLNFIAQISSISPRVKWIVSSRNWPSIEMNFTDTTRKIRLALELNEKSVSAAIATYIQFKVDWLAKQNRYSSDLQDAVQCHLLSNANGTFLWVALVCQELSTIPAWKARRKLTAFPPGLDALYRRMLNQIKVSEDFELCKHILAVVSTFYRPVTLDELASFIDLPDDVSGDYEAMVEIIGLCGSFVTLQGRIVSFVHQSAQDFLLKESSHEIFPSGREDIHHLIFSKSLQIISKTLQRDIYGLRTLGCSIDQVKQPEPDPLAASRYSCIFWVDHLCDWNSNLSADLQIDLQDRNAVDMFLRKTYLYWLEAMSLYKSMPQAVLSMAKLEILIQGIPNAATLIPLVQDAHRFIRYHKQVIENSPLQIYVSALLFSPVGSLIRRLYKDKETKWIMIKPAMEEKWSACLQTLEGHGDWVRSVVFSHDSTRLASASDDRTVKIWDPNSGDCLQTLEGHSSWVRSVVFSHDSTRLASTSSDRTVKIWDPNSGDCLQTLEGHGDWVHSVVFSHDSTRLASASVDRTVKIWDPNSGDCLQTLEGHSNWVRSVVFSHDSTRLASASVDRTVKIWDPNSGDCLQTLEGHSDWVHSVVFSHDSTRLASASEDHIAKIWDPNSGNCLQTLDIGESPFDMTFDTAGSYLHTNIGTIAVDVSRALNVMSSTMPSRTDSQIPWCQDVGLSLDGVWITYNSKNLLWLPLEYRPSCLAMSRKTVGIGTGSGKVWVCDLKIDAL